MKRYILPILFAMIAGALALTSCEEDDIQIDSAVSNNQSTVDPGTATAIASLSSDYAPGTDIVLFPIGNPMAEDRDPQDLGAYDKLTFSLLRPFDHDVTIRIGMDPLYATGANNGTYASEYAGNFGKAHNLFCDYGVWQHDGKYNITNTLFINNAEEAVFTIKAGELKAQTMDIFVSREVLRWNFQYLLPIQATDVETGEIYAQINYIAQTVEPASSQVGVKPAVFVGYIDTEVMNPLIVNEMRSKIKHSNFDPWEENLIYSGFIYDIINLRTASISEEKSSPKLSLTADLLHVLKNRSKYIAPIQHNNIKVCLTIKGSGASLGLSNMTDNQIAAFVKQVKVTVDMYHLDGVNLWDENTPYGKDDSSPSSGEAFAKLIKAMKQAMPDKLLTLVDTRATTEPLCDSQAGISIGDYLDYAWSSLEDFLLPYEPNASVRPLANVSGNKYGSFFIRDFMLIPEETQMKWMEEPGLLSDILNGTLAEPVSGTDVAVTYDIPYFDYGKEGVWTSTWIVWCQARFPIPLDFSSMTSVEPDIRRLDYYEYKKDW